MPPQLAGDVALTTGLATLWAAAIGNRTRATYHAGFNSYVKFLVLYNLLSPWSGALPYIDETLLLFYVSYCFCVRHIKHTTVKTYLSGIRYEYTMNGVHTLFDESGHGSLNRLQLILRGYKKLQGSAAVKRLPITYSVLQSILDVLDHHVFGPFNDLVLQAMCITAFLGFLRVSEFTCTGHFDPDINLCIGDIIFNDKDKTVAINLKVSKTDPFRQGIVISLYGTGHSVCPYNILKKVKQVRLTCGARSMDPFFVDNAGKCFTRTMFLDKLRIVLVRVGVDANLYNTHSFRIGAASTAASVRLEDHLIKTLGRWNSDSYLRYIHTPPEVIKAAQLSLSHSHPQV